MRLLNVLLASSVSVYPLAFVLEKDILSICSNKDAVTFRGTTICGLPVAFVAIQ